MSANILLYDIETCPFVAKIWDPKIEYVPHDRVVAGRSIIGIGAKWLHEDNVMYFDLSQRRNKRDDRPLMKPIYDLFNKADVMVTQNGKKFDERIIRNRLIVNGYGPYAPSRHIDTRLIAKKLGFPYCNLDYLCQQLGVPRKLQHKKYPGNELWDECIDNNNQDAWQEMEKYCKQDVLSLEGVYLKFRAWDTTVSVALDGPGCRACGGFNFQARGYDRNKMGRYARYKCMDCGAWGKTMPNLTPSEERRRIKRNI